MYKINPESYMSVFVLPTQIADKHLRMAGKAQLKVLLWLFRNPSEGTDTARISQDTGIPEDEIDDAMLYWMEAGVVLKDGEKVAPMQRYDVVPVTEKRTEVTAAEKQTEKAARQSVPMIKPSIRDIANRMEQSAEIRNMFNEVEVLYGRTLGNDSQTSLLMLHDHYGLPAEVIIMLCGYAKNVGKHTTLNYIMKMGADWAEKEINTFELATEKIARLENADKMWTAVKQATGIENPRPTSKQSSYLEIWVNDYGFGIDMIELAYEKTVEKKGNISFGYMNGILKAWHEKGMKSPADVEAGERRFAEEKAGKNKKYDGSGKNGGSSPSYDIDLFLQQSMIVDPTKIKKGQ